MIKKSLLTFVLLIAATLYCSAQGIGVVIVDKVGPFTNIRNAPNGKIVKKIATDKTVGLVVTSPKNGWWRIVGDSYDDYDIGDPSEEVKLTGSKSGYWIHYSCIGFFTRNYGGQRITLRSAPSSKAKAVYSFKIGATYQAFPISHSKNSFGLSARALIVSRLRMLAYAAYSGGCVDLIPSLS